MLILTKKRRAGDRRTIHTPGEVVHCDFVGAEVVATCSTTGARRALERKGFKLQRKVEVVKKPPPRRKKTVAAPAKVVIPKEEPKLGIEFPVLRESVDDLEESLKTGAHDHNLSDLLKCEKSSKGRKTAIEAIQGRIDHLKK